MLCDRLSTEISGIKRTEQQSTEVSFTASSIARKNTFFVINGINCYFGCFKMARYTTAPRWRMSAHY